MKPGTATDFASRFFSRHTLLRSEDLVIQLEAMVRDESGHSDETARILEGWSSHSCR